MWNGREFMLIRSSPDFSWVKFTETHGENSLGFSWGTDGIRLMSLKFFGTGFPNFWARYQWQWQIPLWIPFFIYFYFIYFYILKRVTLTAGRTGPGAASMKPLPFGLVSIPAQSQSHFLGRFVRTWIAWLF
jgi:hypothetical protein